jgi:hypothetical protein
MSSTWIFLLPFYLLTLKPIDQNNSNLNVTPIDISIGDSLNQNNLFFDYEVIEHYSNPNPNITQFAGRFETDEEHRKRMVVFANMPLELKDTAFIDELRSFGYRRKYVKPTKFRELNKLFCHKEYDDLSVRRCSAVYTDILIFRKENRIVGIAKLDFVGCQFYFVGALVETKNFGRAGEFLELKKILEYN